MQRLWQPHGQEATPQTEARMRKLLRHLWWLLRGDCWRCGGTIVNCVNGDDNNHCKACVEREARERMGRTIQELHWQSPSHQQQMTWQVAGLCRRCGGPLVAFPADPMGAKHCTLCDEYRGVSRSFPQTANVADELGAPKTDRVSIKGDGHAMP
jgi:hypothetical protein